MVSCLITNPMVLPSPESPPTEGFSHSSGLFIFLVSVPRSQPTSLLVTAALQLISQPDPPSVTFSWLCSLLLLLFSQQCTFCLLWCRFGVWHPLSFAVRQKGVWFLQGSLFSLCFLLGKKGLKLEVCRDPGTTPACGSKAEFCSLCFPILFSGLLCSRLPFPWIWLLSGKPFTALTPWHCICLCICTDPPANQFSFQVGPSLLFSCPTWLCSRMFL